MADPVLPTSTNNVTTRKLAATITGVWAKIDGKKADKVSGATGGNFASLDGNGNLADSGHKHSDYASSTQGGKADTAVQSVKMVSSSGTELKSGTNVIIPLAVKQGASGATAGLISAEDKKKLDEIESGAEANQNAFSNIQVGETTVAADTTTDTLTIAGSNHVTVTGNSADDSITISTDLSSKSASSGSDEVSLVTRGEKYTWGAKQDTIAFDGTYNATSNKAATVSTVTNAINALDVNNITTNLSKSKTITALSETDGKISATAEAIEIAESQVTGLVADLASKAPLDSPAFTGTPTAPTAETGTNTTQIATTEFVNNEISAKMAETDAMVYQGTLAGGSTSGYGALTPAANKGYTYKVTTAGKIDGVAVEVGDMLICNTDNTAAATSSNYSTIKANWDFIQTNIDGAVTGPASSTASSVAGFADATGKKIKQLTASEIKTAAGLDLVVNQAITVTDTSVSDGTHTFNKYVHPTTTSTNAAPVKVGKDSLGHVVIGDALTKADVGLGNVVNTGDSDTPVSGGTTKFTTGGAYTELNKKVDKETGKGLSSNDYTDTDKTKLAGIAEGAEVNQNAFSNIKVGSTTVAADTKTDTVEFVGSGHVTITGDATNDKVTIQTDLSSKTAASGGTTESLVTTGEKYTWNNKAAGDHTHATSIAADSSTGTVVSLSANTQYKLTAGGTNVVFKTPADTNTHRPIKVNGTQALGNDTTALNLVAGSNVSITDGGSGSVTIASTYAHPAYDAATAAAKKIGRDATGHVVIGDSLTKSDVGLGNVANTNITVSATAGVKDVTNNVTYKYTHPTATSHTAAAVKVGNDGSGHVVIGDALTAEDVGLGNVANTNITVSATDGVKDVTNNVTYKYSHPTTTAASAAAVKVGKDSLGHVVIGSALTKSDVGLGNVANTTITVTSSSVSDGTNTFNKYVHPTTTAASAAAVKVGKDSTGHVVIGSALTKSDVGLGNVANTTITVTSTSVSDGTNTFNKYVHPTTAGNKHIPSGGSSGQILGYASDGTAQWMDNTSAAHGQGYSGTATNSSGTFAVTMSGYTLVEGGIVSIRFGAAVPASAKLNINGQGAKNVYYGASAIGAGIIQAGDTATFMYDGTQYRLLCVDRSAGEMTDQEVTDIIDALT